MESAEGIFEVVMTAVIQGACAAERVMSEERVGNKRTSAVLNL